MEDCFEGRSFIHFLCSEEIDLATLWHRIVIAEQRQAGREAE